VRTIDRVPAGPSWREIFFSQVGLCPMRPPLINVLQAEPITTLVMTGLGLLAAAD